MRDFVDVYPKFCAIFTSLPKDNVKPQWARQNIGITLGSLLGMNEPSDIYALMDKMGFSTTVVSEVPEIFMTSNSQTLGNELIGMAGLSQGNCRIVRMMSRDMVQNSGTIFLCWFFGPKVSDLLRVRNMGII